MYISCVVLNSAVGWLVTDVLLNMDDSMGWWFSKKKMTYNNTIIVVEVQRVIVT